jgi:NAD(P)H dehydrogenase (quinone)
MHDPYILILYYSRTGATAELARYIARGVEMTEGITAKIRTVPPVSATCEKMDSAIPKDGPPYATLEDLQNCSGLALGSPTRFGNMAAPLKFFLDSSSTLWVQGSLVNKPGCVFSASGSMHGGQETTLISLMLPLLHHGMIIVGLPYTIPELNNTQTGGTPYGVTHVSGMSNNTALSTDEMILAKQLGKRIATIAIKIKSY